MCGPPSVRTASLTASGHPPHAGSRGCGVLRLLAIYTLTSSKNLQIKQMTTLFLAGAAVAAAGAGLFALPGCGQANADKPRVKIVATTFPIYDWTREVLGERLAEADLVLLQQSGADLHSYSPSAADLRQIAACDLFVFVGGESDEWTERALAQKGNPRRRMLNLVKTLGSAAKEEKIVEGMEHEHHHHDAKHDDDHDHDKGKHDDHVKKHDHDEKHDDHGKHHDDDHDEDEHEIDEHVWLSLRNATTLVKSIATGVYPFFEWS